MIRLLLLSLLSLTACCQHRPTVYARSEYFNEKYLATSHIDLPNLYTPCFNGQQIVLNWNVLTRCLPATIILQVRYGNHECAEVTYQVDVPRGFKVYRLLNNEFWDKKGIASYSLKIYSGDECIGTWNHHLWADVIEF